MPHPSVVRSVTSHGEMAALCLMVSSTVCLPSPLRGIVGTWPCPSPFVHRPGEDAAFGTRQCAVGPRQCVTHLTDQSGVAPLHMVVCGLAEYILPDPAAPRHGAAKVPASRTWTGIEVGHPPGPQGVRTSLDPPRVTSLHPVYTLCTAKAQGSRLTSAMPGSLGWATRIDLLPLVSETVTSSCRWYVSEVTVGSTGLHNEPGERVPVPRKVHVLSGFHRKHQAYISRPMG
jgi:hypothetical protein